MAAIVAIDTMATTTIQIDESMKKKLQSFGTKGESYNEIINRIYSIASRELLRDFLMSSEGTITLAEARARHAKKWSS